MDNPGAVAETEHAGTCRSRTALPGHLLSLPADRFQAVLQSRYDGVRPPCWSEL